MNDRLLQPWEAAQRLGVDVKTLVRWANAKKIHYTKTLGGHRRYRESVVNAILEVTD